MGLTSALNTSLIGLTLNETSIDVLGNNIANAGTNGFKASTVRFSTQLSRTLSVGSAPTGGANGNGGTNPRQIGLGAQTAAITKDFSQGGITSSTSPSDLAIQGEGFFVVQGQNGEVYTRNGSFTKNSANKLVNAQGLRVQGYGVDDEFNLVPTPGALVDLTIPVGDLNIAQASGKVSIAGALLTTSAAETATQGSAFLSDAFIDATTTAAITAATLLTDVQDGGGTNLFTAGHTLTFSPAKGGVELEPQTLAVDGATVGDLLALFENTIGIHSYTGAPGSPGVTLTAGGEISVVGNIGTLNDIDDLSVGRLTSTTADGLTTTDVQLPFIKSQSANGETASTPVVVYDSLGEPINLVIRTVKDSSSTARWFAESAEDSDADVVLGSGQIVFNPDGSVNTGQTDLAQITIHRNDSNALNVTLDLDFSNLSGITNDGSAINASADGFPAGTLTDFVIDEAGIINGEFNNGIIRTLGQVVLATFRNPQGLIENGGDTFAVGVSSGTPVVGTPGSFGYGTIRGGAIELSNTDIGRNLVDLIVASTNYRGNARVISSVQQLVDELLVLGR